MNRVAALASALCLASCADPAASDAPLGGDGPGGGGNPACGEAPTWNRDVAPLVAERCMPCHADPPQGAPVPLTRYAHTRAIAPSSGVEVSRAMADRVSSDEFPMPPSPHERLSAEEQALIAAWADAGAPEACPGDPAPPEMGEACGVSESWGPPSFEFRMPGHELKAVDNDWHCSAITVPPGKKEHLVRMAPLLDPATAANVHHILVFRDPGKTTPEGDFSCGSATSAHHRILGGWAPGVCSFELPKDAGLPIQPGDRLILQVHYHNPQRSRAKDSSGIGFWYSPELRQHDAGVMTVGDVTLAIPPGKERHEEQGYCPWLTASETKVFAAFPHMHQLGRGMRTELFRNGQRVGDIVRDDAWDFAHQQFYSVEPAVTVAPGDLLRTTCTYDSTGRRAVTLYGDRTEDEMCFNFLLYYPYAPTDPIGCY